MEPYLLKKNVAVHYKYVTDTERSGQEKDLIVKDIPKIAEDSESTYYLVYCMDEKAQLGQLPNTGGQNSLWPCFIRWSSWLDWFPYFCRIEKERQKESSLKVVLM